MKEASLLQAIQLAKAGDMAVTEVIWQALRPIWCKWAKQTTLSEFEHEDLVQQSYLILLEALAKYQEDSTMTFSGYYKIRLHVWTGRKQRQAKPIYPTSQETLERLQSITDKEMIPQQIEDKIQSEPIKQAIREFSEIDQLILYLSILQERKAKDIGKLINLSPGGVRKRKQRLVEAIKKAMPPP